MEPPTASTAMVSHTPKAKGDSYPQCMTYVFSPFTSRVFDRNPNAACTTCVVLYTICTAFGNAWSPSFQCSASPRKQVSIFLPLTVCTRS